MVRVLPRRVRALRVLRGVLRGGGASARDVGIAGQARGEGSLFEMRARSALPPPSPCTQPTKERGNCTTTPDWGSGGPLGARGASTKDSNTPFWRAGAVFFVDFSLSQWPCTCCCCRRHDHDWAAPPPPCPRLSLSLKFYNLCHRKVGGVRSKEHAYRARVQIVEPWPDTLLPHASQ